MRRVLNCSAKNSKRRARTRRRQVVIDEVQKVPALLDEVHWLIENRGLSFALLRFQRAQGAARRRQPVGRGAPCATTCGDSPQGRSRRPSTSTGRSTTATCPGCTESARPRRLLDAYIGDYLRQEIAAEGLVRNLPAFSDFLDAAALSDGDPVNYSNIARDCGVSGPTAKAYFGILEGHVAGPPPAALAEAGEAPPGRGAQALLRGCGHREPSGPPRPTRTGLGPVRQGVRELGLPRALLIHLLPRPR